MTQPALDTLLALIDDASAAGADPEYDPQFGELERAAAPKAERSIGDTVKAAEEPDWGKVAPLARALLARSKDPRAAIRSPRRPAGAQTSREAHHQRLRLSQAMLAANLRRPRSRLYVAVPVEPVRRLRLRQCAGRTR